MYEIQSVTADSIKTMCSVELEAVCFRWKKDIETAQFNLNSVEPLIPQRRNQEVIARKKKQDEQIELERKEAPDKAIAKKAGAKKGDKK